MSERGPSRPRPQLVRAEAGALTLDRELLRAREKLERFSAQGDESKGRSATGVDAPSLVRE